MLLDHSRDLLLAISSLLLLRCIAVPISRGSLGIAPQDEEYYRGNVIGCRDGSKSFTKEQLNDDFCDCNDGTDEPGTSACPEGKFYCRNAGHVPRVIFSSRVNDGICDCCDGSDEYDGKMKCSNTCLMAGKAAREKLKKKIAMYKEGVTVRKGLVKKALDAFAKDEFELSKLKSEEKSLEMLVRKLEVRKKSIEEAEEQERLRKEKEDKEARDFEIKEKKLENHSKDLLDNLDTDDLQEELPLPLNQDSKESSYTEAGKGNDLNNDDTNKSSQRHDDSQDETSVNDDGLTKEELGRLVASRWTGESIADTEDRGLSGDLEGQKESSDFPGSGEQDYDAYNSYEGTDIHGNHNNHDDNEYEEKYSEDTHEELTHGHGFDAKSNDREIPSDFTVLSSPSWWSRIRETFQDFLQALNLFKAPVNVSEAAQVRKENEDASLKLSEMQSRISILTEKLRLDYGAEKEFYSFHGQCFETKENKYIYKLCPFKEASQIEGYSTTRLGNWDKFEEYYSIMKFSHGDRCWNGPARSLEVRLRCGLKNELADVDEPSRCEYTATLSTPMLCLESKLKELQDKLYRMNSDQISIHDEF